MGGERSRGTKRMRPQILGPRKIFEHYKMNFRIKEDRSLCKSSETSIGRYSDEAVENTNKFSKAPVQCLDREPVRKAPSVHLCTSVTTSVEIWCKLAPSEAPF